MKQVMSILVIGIILSVAVSCAAAEDAMNGPWDSWVKSETPVADNSVLTAETREVSFNLLVWGVRLFQRYISAIDGARCSMYPTCSHYSLLAFKKHGPVMGYIMTIDRLIHESDEPRFIPRIEKHGFIRFYDPVENNDFWWYEPDPPAGDREADSGTASTRIIREFTHAPVGR